MRKKIIAANWKLNKNIEEAKEFAKNIKKNDNENILAIVFPTFTSMHILKDNFKEKNIHMGAQNFYYENSGAFTGEISLELLKDFKIDYAIIGHSERRTIFKEDEKLLNKKLKSAIKENICPVVCFGEKINDREEGKYFEKIEKDIDEVFKDINKLDENIIIAYEPLWAIGTGKIPTNYDIEEMAKFIRKKIEIKYGEDISKKTHILYGGSVNITNVSKILKNENIDGVLIGGASLCASNFNEFLKIGGAL